MIRNAFPLAPRSKDSGQPCMGSPGSLIQQPKSPPILFGLWPESKSATIRSVAAADTLPAAMPIMESATIGRLRETMTVLHAGSSALQYRLSLVYEIERLITDAFSVRALAM